jgi:hypothetical protein
MIKDTCLLLPLSAVFFSVLNVLQIDPTHVVNRTITKTKQTNTLRTEHKTKEQQDKTYLERRSTEKRI